MHCTRWMYSPLLFTGFKAIKSSRVLTAQKCTAGLERCAPTHQERWAHLKVKTDKLRWGPCLLVGYSRSYPKSYWNVTVEFSTKGWPPGNTLAAELTGTEGCRACRFAKTPSFHGRMGDAFPLGWVFLTVCVLYSQFVPAPWLLHSKKPTACAPSWSLASIWYEIQYFGYTAHSVLINCLVEESCSTKH